MKLARSGTITKVVVFAIIIYAVANLMNLQVKTDTARAQRDALKKQITEIELANAELEYQIAHSDEDEVLAKIARNDFGLVMPGEIIFYGSGSAKAD